MDSGLGTELRTLLRAIFELEEPREARLRTDRPQSLDILKPDWMENLVQAIVEGVLMTFDLRRKTENDVLAEIQEWTRPTGVNGWVERRKNHRLRIRTMVDDLFEEGLALSNVTANVRAWKLRVADTCADTVLERYHVRPASSGPWASQRQKMRQIGDDLQRALGYKDLFLMTGRVAEAKTMQAIVDNAHQAMQELITHLEESDLLGQTK